MNIRRGIIRAFDSGTYLADVQIVGSMATILTGVPVAKQVGAGLLTSGAKCGVLFFDETNPSDACVVFVYDGAPVAWVTSALIKDGEVAVGDLAFDPVTQAELDAHAALPSVHHSHSCARVYHNVAQTLANATLTTLAFNSERFDTDGMHDNVTNNSRLTCKTAGKYQITGQVRFAANATGVRAAYIRLNGVTYIAVSGRPSASAVNINDIVVTTLYDLAINDYVEILVYQNSGATLDVVADGNYSPEFMMVRVG